MMAYDAEEAEKIVKHVARRVGSTRLYPSRKAELNQVGHLAILEARRTFDPEKCDNFSAYAHRAVVFALKRWLWRQHTIVSGGTHSPRDQVKGLICFSLDYDDEDREIEADEDDTETMLERAEWAHRVRRRLEVIAARHGISAIVDVALEERPAESLCSEYGIDEPRVRALVRQLHKAVAEDSKSAKLYALRPEAT